MGIERIYASLPELETDRLRLRRISMRDAEDMYAYASNDEVAQYVTWETHRSIEDSKRFIQYILAQYAKHDIAPWGIELKENRRLIGTVDFVWWRPEHQSAEIGYVLARELGPGDHDRSGFRALEAWLWRNGSDSGPSPLLRGQYRLPARHGEDRHAL